MDMLKTDVKKIFFKYLSASFGSALIAAIYSIVDVAMVGQYEGDNGAAALAVFAPIWNVIYGIGLLFGIGGSVLFSKAKGSGEYDKQNNLDPDFKYDENFFLTRTTELELKNLELNENILTAQFESISNIFSEQSILKLSQVLNASITIKFYEENFFYGITKANQVECFTVSEETKLNDINENMYKQLETELLSKFEKKKEH